MAGGSRVLLHRIALVAFVALLAVGIVLRDIEAIVFSTIVFVGIMLLPFRNGVLGRIVLALICADVAFWMLPAAFSNVRHHDELAFVAVPVGLGALAVAGLLAAAGLKYLVVPLALLVLAVGAVAYSQVASGDEIRGRAGDLAVSAKNVRFSPETLAAKNGEVVVRLKNKDLFWHTVTIDALGLDLRVPVGATRRASFEAPAGRYEFYCAIPGHKQAGMKGTLRVG
jgi:plastocyanin